MIDEKKDLKIFLYKVLEINQSIKPLTYIFDSENRELVNWFLFLSRYYSFLCLVIRAENFYQNFTFRPFCFDFIFNEEIDCLEFSYYANYDYIEFDYRSRHFSMIPIKKK